MERFPCDPERECKLRDTIGCFEDVHHLVYPARDYRDPIGKQYRNLDEHKEETCRARHNEIHATEQPPLKPTKQQMLAKIALSVNANKKVA